MDGPFQYDRLPNGHILTHDVENVAVHPITSSWRNNRLFADGMVSDDEPGVPDGMKCDAHGNIWVTAPGGIWVFDPRGNHLGVVTVPCDLFRGIPRLIDKLRPWPPVGARYALVIPLGRV